MLGLNPDKDLAAEFTMLGWTLVGNNIAIDTDTTDTANTTTLYQLE